MELDLPHFSLPFFTNLLILLLSARLLGELFERFKQPSMIGEILAGVILGPSLFNLIHRTEEIKVISELGVFLLVIIAGLEINIDDILKSFKGKNIIISLLAFFVPIASGLAVGFAFNLDLITTVFIALCVAITALPVSIRILMDLGKINSEIGQRIISVAIFDDVLALTILGIILNVKETDMSLSSIGWAIGVSVLKLVILLSLLVLIYGLIKRIAKRENYVENSLNKILNVLKGKESLFAIFFVFILLFSTITESLGLHFIIGAFFASMLIGENIVGKKHLDTIHNTTNSLAMGFLAPIFFAGIGLEFKLGAIANVGLLISVLVVSYLSKIIGGYVGSKIAGMNTRKAFIMGIGLNARGIMELVIANIAFKAGLINIEIFSILVLMGIITTLTTPIMLKRNFRKLDEAEGSYLVPSQ